MSIDYESIRTNSKTYFEAIVATNQALLGMIPFNLRALGIEFNIDHVVYTAIYDNKPTDEDFDNISTAICEATTHILNAKPLVHSIDRYLTVPYPGDLIPYVPNWGWVYLRKEPVDFIRVPKEND